MFLFPLEKFQAAAPETSQSQRTTRVQKVPNMRVNQNTSILNGAAPHLYAEAEESPQDFAIPGKSA